MRCCEKCKFLASGLHGVENYCNIWKAGIPIPSSRCSCTEWEELAASYYVSYSENGTAMETAYLDSLREAVEWIVDSFAYHAGKMSARELNELIESGSLAVKDAGLTMLWTFEEREA